MSERGFRTLKDDVKVGPAKYSDGIIEMSIETKKARGHDGN